MNNTPEYLYMHRAGLKGRHPTKGPKPGEAPELQKQGP